MSDIRPIGRPAAAQQNQTQRFTAEQAAALELMESLGFNPEESILYVPAADAVQFPVCNAWYKDAGNEERSWQQLCVSIYDNQNKEYRGTNGEGFEVAARKSVNLEEPLVMTVFRAKEERKVNGKLIEKGRPKNYVINS